MYVNGPLATNGLGSVRVFESKRQGDVYFNFNLAPGRMAGAQMIVELGPQNETRTQKGGAVGGPQGGRKLIRYMVLLHIFHRSMMAHAEDGGADLDGLLEAFYNLIRTDHTLGGAVVQAGESPYGIRTSPPALNIANNKVESYVAISFEADVEIVA